MSTPTKAEFELVVLYLELLKSHDHLIQLGIPEEKVKELFEYAKSEILRILR